MTKIYVPRGGTQDYYGGFSPSDTAYQTFIASGSKANSLRCFLYKVDRKRPLQADRSSLRRRDELAPVFKASVPIDSVGI